MSPNLAGSLRWIGINSVYINLWEAAGPHCPAECEWDTVTASIRAWRYGGGFMCNSKWGEENTELHPICWAFPYQPLSLSITHSLSAGLDSFIISLSPSLLLPLCPPITLLPSLPLYASLLLHCFPNPSLVLPSLVFIQPSPFSLSLSLILLSIFLLFGLKPSEPSPLPPLFFTLWIKAWPLF